MRDSYRLRLGLFLGVGIGAALLAFAADTGGILRSQELSTVDLRFSTRGTQAPPASVVVVGIDDVSFNALHQRWPFPRLLHAKLIDRLRVGGAKVIAYDVQFTEPTDAADDNALIEAVARAGNLVLAATEVNAKGQTDVLGGGGLLRQIHAVAGSALLPTDGDGVIRRVPYEVNGLTSFAVETAERATGKTIDPSALGGSSGWIDYAGPAGTVRTVSFSNVLDGKIRPAFFHGKIVVIGPVAPSLQDIHPTSAGPLHAGGRGRGERDLDRAARLPAAERAELRERPADRPPRVRRAACVHEVLTVPRPARSHSARVHSFAVACAARRSTRAGSSRSSIRSSRWRCRSSSRSRSVLC